MDSCEAAKIVHDRIKELEPNVTKMILAYYLYSQEITHQEMIRLALGPNTLIHDLIQKLKSSHFGQFQARYFSNVMDYNSVKSCHYFNRGFCKHGNNCRYFHGPDTLGPNSYEDYHHQVLLLHPLSLERLELEIVQLLKARKGHPISIASLPMMYFERYGRTLQAEGYLTESQRHGKAGYNLTRLLAQLKNIRLIDRPHGQHAVMLAEDAPNKFGPVQDVRIPFQQKRMFGFVTFVSAYTVKLILSQGNPHHVCGARVLVKPYREKSKLSERKYLNFFDPPMQYYFDYELESRFSYDLPRRRFMVDYDKALEIETRHLSGLLLAPKFECPVKSCSDQESAEGLNLPDSPFASSVTEVI
ncbi:hypothetical protein CASFOL_018675 [Castilleja foliolosa]|uniref:C3H1-type domain-containing protein n=1 Tax=Castilleja foliolosa TaxID=1961234 RepID=A0ABD3D727_9LAMI